MVKATTRSTMPKRRPSYHGRLPGARQIGGYNLGCWWTVTSTGWLIANVWVRRRVFRLRLCIDRAPEIEDR